MIKLHKLGLENFKSAFFLLNPKKYKPNMSISKSWTGWGAIIGALITASVTIAIFFLQKENNFPYTLQIHNQITQEIMQNVKVVIEVEGEKFDGKTDSDGNVEIKINKKFKDKPAQLKVEDKDGYVQYQKDIQLKAPKEKDKTLTQKVSVPPFKRFVIPPVSDKIAEGAYKDTSFEGKENVPILIEVKVLDKIGCRVEILNVDEEILLKKGTIWAADKFEEIPFTPSKTATYTVRVWGQSKVGTYLLHLSYIDEESQTPNEVIALTDNADKYSNRVGEGAYDDYTFEGFVNTPVILQTRTEDRLGYRIFVLNKDEEVLWKKGTVWASDAFEENPFTPTEDGTYTLRIEGKSNFGEYAVKYYTLDKPALQIVEIGERYEYSLAEGAYDDYQLEGIANTPLIIKTMGKGGKYNMGYSVQILDAAGEQVQRKGRHWTATKFDEMTFTPTVDGTYIIRVLGESNFGEYVLMVEEAYSN